MIKAAIFDIGGVLLRWTNLPMFEDMDQTLRIPEEIRKEAWTKLSPPFEVGKIKEPEFWQEFTKMTQAEGELPQESLIQREFKKRFTLDTDVVAIAHRLKENGLKLGIISNTIDPHAEILRNSNLFDSFDFVILSNEVGLRKPDSEIYELALAKSGVKSDEAFFVDDLPENIEGAEKVGIHGIQFVNKDQLLSEIKKLGVEI